MSIWGNSDLLDSVVLIASGIVALYAAWELVQDEIDYRKGKADKPAQSKRVGKILLALLGILIFVSSWRSSVIGKAEDHELRQELRLTQKQLIQRSLSESQEQDLVQVLKKSGLKARIPVMCPETSESMILAAQIIRVLQRAGWDTESAPGLASPSWQGIVLTVESLDNVPPSASLLADQLEGYGFSVTLTDRQGAPKVNSLSGSKTLSPLSPPLDLLNLWIGEKPSLK